MILKSNFKLEYLSNENLTFYCNKFFLTIGDVLVNFTHSTSNVHSEQELLFPQQLLDLFFKFKLNSLDFKSNLKTANFSNNKTCS